MDRRDVVDWTDFGMTTGDLVAVEVEVQPQSEEDAAEGALGSTSLQQAGNSPPQEIQRVPPDWVEGGFQSQRSTPQPSERVGPVFRHGL